MSDDVFVGQNIILGITGGIAAYKAAELTSRLTKAGAQVHVIMTKGAQDFITPLTLQEISGQRVNVGMWEQPGEFQIEHISLANLANMVLVAPATANIIAKLAHGLADDMLTTTILATKAPLIISPAMNTNMYENPATQENLTILKKRGVHIIPPASGRLACGVEGVGRLPEPAEIFAFVQNFWQSRQSWRGKKIIVTAGGTVAPIDPVRYIGNRSTGKMGYAVAAAALRRGAEVALVSASHLAPPNGVKFIPAATAEDMRRVVLNEFSDAHSVIMAAAVSDYQVKNVATQKIKKGKAEWQITLTPGPDILRELGRLKRPEQLLVGFAAETENLLAYAEKKLHEKNLDFIVANDVSQPGAGFGTDTNIAVIIGRNGEVENCPLMDKTVLAEKILDKMEKCFGKKE